MIATITFENEAEDILRPYEDYGILLVSFDAPAPTPKVNRVTIEGMDGTLDMTEWAGEVRYNNRNLTMTLRDMQNRLPNPIANFCNGQVLKITHSDEPNWYYYGRCELISEPTKSRVRDTQLGFVCEPYKQYKTNITRTIYPQENDEEIEVGIQQMFTMSVVPTITTSGDCTLTFAGVTYQLTEGTHIIPSIVLSKTRKPCIVSGGVTLTFSYKGGAL